MSADKPYAHTDGAILDSMAELLSGEEWDAGTIEEVADLVRATGRVIEEPGAIPQPCSECGRERPDLMHGKCRPCWSRLLDKPEVSA